VTANRFADRIRALALSFPEAYEDEPWGHPVFKVADNRMFAGMSADAEAVHLTVKLTAEEACSELAAQPGTAGSGPAPAQPGSAQPQPIPARNHTGQDPTSTLSLSGSTQTP